MHRFRKKSDAKRVPLPENYTTSSTPSGPAPGQSRIRSPHPSLVAHSSPVPRPGFIPPSLPITLQSEVLPGLDSFAGDFRSSIILTDLSRRFSLLRTTAGAPVSPHTMRSRFQRQRLKGAQNAITEEEEDMIVDALNHIRDGPHRTSSEGNPPSHGEMQTDDTIDSGYFPSSSEEFSVRTKKSSTSSTGQASLVDSISSRQNKRHSNHLFSSGRFRDQSYIRSVALKKSQSRSQFAIQGASSSETFQLGVPLSATTEHTPFSLDTAGSHDTDEHALSIRSAPLLAPHPFESSTTSLSEKRASKPMTPAALKRLSAAFQDVLREIEEETEDEIVLPRFPRVARSPQHHLPDAPKDRIDSEPSILQGSPSEPVERGLAVSPDNTAFDSDREPFARSNTVSPTPRVAGYIPGMPRPRTPRNVDVAEQRPDSTTPRPTSPDIPPHIVADGLKIISPRFRPGALRMDLSGPSMSTASPQLETVSAAPLSLLPERPRTPGVSERNQKTQTSVDSTKTTDLSFLVGKRSSSPFASFAGNVFSGFSRPGTPSNITWTSRPSSPRPPSRNGGHSRSGSTTSVADPSSNLQRSMSPARVSRSSAIPDSPYIDGSQYANHEPLIGFGYRDGDHSPSEVSPASIGSPALTTKRELRSPTPTRQYPAAHSPHLGEHQHTQGQFSSVASPSSPFSGSGFSLPPNNPLVISPMPNSSRSSLVSTGSSYHSEEGGKDRIRPFDLFTDVESNKPAWHDLSRSTSQTDVNLTDDPEKIMQQLTGLTKIDFVFIQEKLVQTAKAKIIDEEARERAPSLRRRRPSTAHSVHSVTARDRRSPSPAPQSVAPLQLSSSQTLGKMSNNVRDVHKELMESVVNSIEPFDAGMNRITFTDQNSTSSPARRHRDLVDAMFGPSSSFSITQGSESFVPDFGSDEPYMSLVDDEPVGPSPPSEASPTLPGLSLTSQSLAPQVPSTAASRPLNMEHGQLEKEVQRKAEAAMAALHRTPIQPQVIVPPTPAQKRRIKAHTISSPRLVSATTSVETIPLPATASQAGRQASSRLGDRFKLKLKASTRSRPGTPNTEPTPWSSSPVPTPSSSSFALTSPPPSAQTITYPDYLLPPRVGGAVSATELGGFKVPNPPLPSPPASAAPGIRGFMSRFRKSRPAEYTPDYDRSSLHPHHPHHSPPVSPRSVALSPGDMQGLQTSVPFGSGSSSTSLEPYRTEEPRMSSQQHREKTSKSRSSDVALKQLFDAAKDLGVDHTALNDFLSRSNSKSSRSTAMSNLQNLTRTPSGPKSQPTRAGEHFDKNLPTPAIEEGRPSTDGHPSSSKEPVSRSSSIRKLLVPHIHLRPHARDQPADDPAKTIVRRTLVFPSEFKTSMVPYDMGTVSRKSSISRKRRSGGSVSVLSSKSVHDRAPTPPPRHAIFTSEPSPPLPGGYNASRVEGLSTTRTPNPVINADYDPYADDPTITGSSYRSAVGASDMDPPAEAPALEVIELANGETIWNVVNRLRDDDTESIYPSTSRASVSSEYSIPRGNSDGIQIFFKEHKKSASKGSNSSFSSRDRPAVSSSAPRPETKVFYSSATQIARLIENLSRGMDSGSFNIMPTDGPSDQLRVQADAHWTVEERLEHMLGALENP